MQLMSWQRSMPRKISPVAGVVLAVIVIVLVLGGSHLGQWLHSDQTITSRTVGNLEEVPILIRHDATISSITFNPQPSADLSFVSSDVNGLVKLWHLDKDAATKQVAVTKQLAMQAGKRIALNPDGKQLASIDLEGSGAKVWDLTQIANMFSSIKDDQVTYSASYSPNGQILASGYADGTIKLWDWQHSKILHRLKAYEGGVSAIAFSPDGQTLASGSMDSADPIKLWNWKTGRLLRQMAGNKHHIAMDFSPNGQTLAIGSCDDSLNNNCTIKLWDWRNGTEVRSIPGEQSYSEAANFTFSPDGQTLAISHENGIKLWNPNDGTETLTIQEGFSPLAFSPDDQTLASSSDNGTIKLWNRSDGRLIRDIQGREKNGSFLRFSSDSRTLISANDYDGAITLWNQRDGTEIFSLPIKGLTSVALSPDGQTLALGNQDQNTQLLSLNYPAKLAQPLNVKLNSGRFVSFSPDQQHLIFASTKEIKRLRLEDHQEVGNIQVEPNEALIDFALSPDGQTLASSEFGGSIKLWNLRDGKIIRTLQTGIDGLTLSLAFSPDGQMLANAFPYKGKIQVWNLRNGRLIHQWDVNRAERVVFSPDGQLLASGNSYGDVQLWKPKTGKKLRTLKGHASGIRTLAFSADGQTLASGSSDQTIKLWRVKQQQ